MLAGRFAQPSRPGEPKVVHRVTGRVDHRRPIHETQAACRNTDVSLLDRGRQRAHRLLIHDRVAVDERDHVASGPASTEVRTAREAGVPSWVDDGDAWLVSQAFNRVGRTPVVDQDNVDIDSRRSEQGLYALNQQALRAVRQDDDRDAREDGVTLHDHSIRSLSSSPVARPSPSICRRSSATSSASVLVRSSSRPSSELCWTLTTSSNMLARKNNRFAGTATPTRAAAHPSSAGKAATTNVNTATIAQNTAYFSRRR